jgi:hypothetical protein
LAIPGDLARKIPDAMLKNTGKVKSHWKKMFAMIYLSSLEGEFWSHGKLSLCSYQYVLVTRSVL